MTIPVTSLPRRPRRATDLDVDEWRLLLAALGALAFASAAIRMLPFRRIVRLASTMKPIGRPRTLDIDALGWAVEAVARRVPWRTVCFQKGLALHLMARRRDIPTVLHYGIGKDDDGALAAHVWISIDGLVVQGGDVADRFRCVASYPPRS